jgi:hypothetical protein
MADLNPQVMLGKSRKRGQQSVVARLGCMECSEESGELVEMLIEEGDN